MNLHPSQASRETSSANCDHEEAAFAKSRSVLEAGKTRTEQKQMQEPKWLLTPKVKKCSGTLVHYGRRIVNWNQGSINMRGQRPAAEQNSSIGQQTRQAEVTGEVETARAAALLHPDAESSRQGISFCSLISQKSKTMESTFFVNYQATQQF